MYLYEVSSIRRLYSAAYYTCTCTLQPGNLLITFFCNITIKTTTMLESGSCNLLEEVLIAIARFLGPCRLISRDKAKSILLKGRLVDCNKSG